MKKYHCYSANFDIETEKLFKEAIFLGQGNNGIVYKLPENKVIKLFIEEKVWRDEGNILSKTNNSINFPKLFKIGEYYIVREMVYGTQFDKYLREKGINEQITYNIYELMKEFQRLQFTKIDTRCKDIYIAKDFSLKVIDPKKCYKRDIDYPRHFMKGLLKFGALEEFLFFLKNIDKEVANNWERKFNEYWKKEKKKKRHKKQNYYY